MDHFCYLCFVFVMLSCLFIAARANLLRVMFLVFLSLTHAVSWVKCGS